MLPAKEKRKSGRLRVVAAPGIRRRIDSLISPEKQGEKGRFRCVTSRRGIFGMTFTGFSVKFGRVGVWGGD